MVEIYATKILDLLKPANLDLHSLHGCGECKLMRKKWYRQFFVAYQFSI